MRFMSVFRSAVVLLLNSSQRRDSSEGDICLGRCLSPLPAISFPVVLIIVGLASSILTSIYFWFGPSPKITQIPILPSGSRSTSIDLSDAVSISAALTAFRLRSVFIPVLLGALRRMPSVRHSFRTDSGQVWRTGCKIFQFLRG